MFGDIPWNVWRYFPECLTAFPGMFDDIRQNVRQHSPECFKIFRPIFGNILRNIWLYSPECLRTFLGMFGYISPKCLATFPRIKHSLHSLRSPYAVPRSCIPGFIHYKIIISLRIFATSNSKEVLCLRWNENH